MNKLFDDAALQIDADTGSAVAQALSPILTSIAHDLDPSQAPRETSDCALASEASSISLSMMEAIRKTTLKSISQAVPGEEPIIIESGPPFLPFSTYNPNDPSNPIVLRILIVNAMTYAFYPTIFTTGDLVLAAQRSSAEEFKGKHQLAGSSFEVPGGALPSDPNQAFDMVSSCQLHFCACMS